MIRVKTPAEQEKVKRACLVSANALAVAGRLIKPGVSTAEVDKAVYDYITAQGGAPSFLGYGGFPASACISINDTVIHGIPGREMVMQEGDIVSVDVGACVDGFHGDNAYTFPCGKIAPEAERLLRATRASLFEGIAVAVPGGRVGDIGAAVQGFVEALGYSVVRKFVGHGVGADLHESPEVPNFGRQGYGPRLVPGMTIAIEPMVNMGGPDVRVLDDEWTVKTVDGSLSAHFEHTILVTQDGPVILTEWQEDPWN